MVSNGDIMDSYLIFLLSALSLPAPTSTKSKKAKRLLNSVKKVSQLARIFYSAVSNGYRRQALQVGKCSNDNVQPVRIIHNSP